MIVSLCSYQTGFCVYYSSSSELTKMIFFMENSNNYIKLTQSVNRILLLKLLQSANLTDVSPTESVVNYCKLQLACSPSWFVTD